MRRAARMTLRSAGFFVSLVIFTIAGHGMAGVLALPMAEAGDDAFRVVTFNVGYIRDPDGLPRWERRRNALSDVLVKANADIIAFQEMETFSGGKFNRVNRQLEWVMAALPDHAAIAIGDPTQFPSTQPILYRRDLFEPVGQGWFYFSPTPDVLFSRSFDGGFDHYASTASLRHKATGRIVSLINLHTDVRSTVNRLGAAELIAGRAAARIAAGDAVIVLGDFNAHAGSPTLKIVKGSGLSGGDGLAPTFHMSIGLPFRLAIDHILTGPGLERIGGMTVHRASQGGIYPSDHYPVSADYRFTD